MTYRVVETPCWGMPYAKRAEYVDSLRDGVCMHDEIRQLVGRADLRNAIGEYLARSVVHVIVDEAFDLNVLEARRLR